MGTSLELYHHVMTDLAEDKQVTVEDFEAAVLFAKSAKRKAPVKKAVAKSAKVVKPAAKKTATVKVQKVVKKCSEAGCQTVASAKGLCSKHYTAKRRQDPAERVKANEASRRWREKNVIIK